MGNRNFKKPVFLRMSQRLTGNYRADNASDALTYLQRYWPGARTKEFRRAYAICESALDDLALAESARGYLVVAAEQAGILDRARMIKGATSASRWAA